MFGDFGFIFCQIFAAQQKRIAELEAENDELHFANSQLLAQAEPLDEDGLDHEICGLLNQGNVKPRRSSARTFYHH